MEIKVKFKKKGNEMNYLSKTILETLTERFKDDKSYLAEKKAEIKLHKDKLDALNYLFSRCDSLTKEDVTKKLAKNGKWDLEDYELEEIVFYASKFIRMI